MTLTPIPRPAGRRRYATELAYLSIANCTDLTDAGAVALRNGTQCKKLQWLDLSGCRVTDRAVPRVACEGKKGVEEE